MTDENNVKTGQSEQEPETLLTLAGFLERSLDRATNILMMRHTSDVCTVYLGDPEGLREDLKQIGAISTALANGILETTSSGQNLLQIGGQTYRFARSFTQVDGVAAVVFAAD